MSTFFLSTLIILTVYTSCRHLSSDLIMHLIVKHFACSQRNQLLLPSHLHSHPNHFFPARKASVWLLHLLVVQLPKYKQNLIMNLQISRWRGFTAPGTKVVPLTYSMWGAVFPA